MTKSNSERFKECRSPRKDFRICFSTRILRESNVRHCFSNIGWHEALQEYSGGVVLVRDSRMSYVEPLPAEKVRLLVYLLPGQVAGNEFVLKYRP